MFELYHETLVFSMLCAVQYSAENRCGSLIYGPFTDLPNQAVDLLLSKFITKSIINYYAREEVEAIPPLLVEGRGILA